MTTDDLESILITATQEHWTTTGGLYFSAIFLRISAIEALAITKRF